MANVNETALGLSVAQIRSPQKDFNLAMALTSELVAGFFIEFRSVSLEDSWQKRR